MNPIVSSSPHAHCGHTVRQVMLDVLVALAPAFIASCVFFGWNAPRLVATCVVSCLATEWACRRLMRRENTLGDLSAVVTGVLLAFNLPPELPWWMAAAGSVFAIAIAKQIFGGLGCNPFNPALAGRAFLLVSFAGAMTTWTASAWNPAAVDAATHATPLGISKEAFRAGSQVPFAFDSTMAWRFFLGDMNGSLGETSALALILGGAYMLLRGVITWHTPVAYIGTVAVYAAIIHAVAPGASLPVAAHLLSGGLMLGAFFMATDMVTTPISRKGQFLFGVGCGLLTMVIRTVPAGAYPEGTSFAILIMNAFTPLINRLFRPRVFGYRKPYAAK